MKDNHDHTTRGDNAAFVIKSITGMSVVTLIVFSNILLSAGHEATVVEQSLFALFGALLGLFLTQKDKILPPEPFASDELIKWALYLVVAYVVTAYLFRRIRNSHEAPRGNDFMLMQIFNGVTFTGSVALIASVVDPRIQASIVETKTFLIIAGLAGAGFSIRSLLNILRNKHN